MVVIQSKWMKQLSLLASAQKSHALHWQWTVGALSLQSWSQWAAPSSKQCLVNPGQVRAALQVPTSLWWVGVTQSQGFWCFSAVKQHSKGALHRKLWGRLVKSVHFLLSYQCKVSKWLHVSGHQGRYELQLCNQTPSKLLSVAPHNSNSGRKKIPLHPGLSTALTFWVHLQETPYFERQPSSNSFKKVSGQVAEEK